MQKQSRKLVLFWDTRRGEVVIKAIGKLVATGVTLFVVWHEFPELATSPAFLVLLMTWGLYAFITFLIDYRDAKKKPLDEKFDELMMKMHEFITEVRRQNNGK